MKTKEKIRTLLKAGVMRLCMASAVFCLVFVSGASAADEAVGTVTVDTLEDLQAALKNPAIERIICPPPRSGPVTSYPSFTFSRGTTTVLACEGRRKIVQVEKPFLPEDGRVTLSGVGTSTHRIVTPAEGDYSTYYLFRIEDDAKLVVSNLTLLGGFSASRSVGSDMPVDIGCIHNRGFLEMHWVDVLRTGVVLRNRGWARALLKNCNLVRNAGWYGGAILNERDGRNTANEGGIVVLDDCSLSENKSLGPAHGGGAIENQGSLFMNNCVFANNSSTEIGGAINNLLGGQIYAMNCTFVGNLSTSEDWGTSAGGAIGCAGRASAVHVVNSFMAYNGYDDGTEVHPSSLGRYNSSGVNVSSTFDNTIYDVIANMPTHLENNDTLTQYAGLVNNIEHNGIIVAASENGMGTSTAFDHPLIATKDVYGSPHALEPTMLAQVEDHYVFANACATYFDYSKMWDTSVANRKVDIDMAFLDVDGEVKAVGRGYGSGLASNPVVGIPENLEASEITVAYGGCISPPDLRKNIK